MRWTFNDGGNRPGNLWFSGLKFAAAGLSGILLNMAHSTWGSGWWALIALVPVMLVSSNTSNLMNIALLGLVASIGPAAMMFESIAVIYPWPALLAVASQAPQIILPLLVWSRFSPIRTGVLRVLAFSLTWVIWEQLRMHPLISGEFASFYSLAYSQVDTGLLVSDYGGLVIISALIATANAVIAANIINRTSLRSLALLVLLLPSVTGTEQYTQVISRAGSIQLIQPAWTPSEYVLLDGIHDDYVAHIDQLTVMMLENGTAVSVNVLPETSLHRSESVERMRSLVADRFDVISGAALTDAKSPSNSVVMFGGNVVEILFRKWQLVPVYETPVFDAGNHLAILQLENELTVGFLVCMDGTSSWLVEQTKRAGADFIVLISASDYGRGYSAPALHLHLVRAQAQLHDVPILFVASNGPSAFITPDGVVRQQIAEGVQGALTTGFSSWEKPSEQVPWFRHASMPVLAVALAATGLFRQTCRRV